MFEEWNCIVDLVVWCSQLYDKVVVFMSICLSIIVLKSWTASGKYTFM